MRVTVTVPDDTTSPLDESWTPEENALALQIGGDAVRRVKAGGGGCAQAREKVLEQVRSVLRGDREEELSALREEAASLREERERLREEAREARGAAARAGDACEAARLRAREEMRAEGEAARREEGERASARASALERDLARARSLLEEERAERERKADALSAAREAAEGEARRLRTELAEMRCSSTKGRAAERRHRDILAEAGFYAVDTSSGRHVRHHHDSLVARVPLLALGEEGRYEAEGGGVRLSLESKQYASAGHMGEELTKFARDRATMRAENRAECFLFVAATSLPQRDHRRYDFEVQQLSEDGSFTVTGYLAASDVGEGEVVSMARSVIALQTCLGSLRRRVPLERGPLRRLARFGEDLIARLQCQLAEADEVCATVKALERKADSLRYSALEALVLHYASLRDEDLVEAASDATAGVERALQSLEGESRGVGTKDKLIRCKGEFDRLKKARGAMLASRGREVEEGGEQGSGSDS